MWTYIYARRSQRVNNVARCYMLSIHVTADKVVVRTLYMHNTYNSCNIRMVMDIVLTNIKVKCSVAVIYT